MADPFTDLIASMGDASRNALNPLMVPPDPMAAQFAPAAGPSPFAGAAAPPFATTVTPAPAQGDPLQLYGDAIANIESSGGRYDLVGPTHPRQGRALGKYQVMENNLPTWLREAGLPNLTPEQFLASPQAQEQVFRHRFGGYLQRFGNPTDAAQAWFAGPGSVGAEGAENRRDSLGTTVSNYRTMFDAYLANPNSARPMALGGPQAPQGQRGVGPQLPPASSLPGNVARPGWMGILDQVGLGRQAPQGGFTPYGAWFDQMPVQQQSAAAALLPIMARIQQDNGGNLTAQQLFQATIRNPQWGEIALHLGSGGPVAMNTIAGALGRKPMDIQVAAPGSSLYPRDPNTGQLGEPITAPMPAVREQFTLGPDDTRFSAAGQPIAAGRPRDPNAQPLANQRADTFQKVFADLAPAQAELGNLQRLQTELGRFTETTPGGLYPWQSFLSRYGINIALTGRPDTDNLNAINALIDRLTPAQRQGLPGAASDTDVRMFRGSLPSLLNSAEGNQRIMANLVALAQRRVEAGHVAGAALEQRISPTAAMALLGAPRDQVQLDHFAEEFPDLRVGRRGDQNQGLGIRNIFEMNSDEVLQIAQRITDFYKGRNESVPSPLERMIRQRWQMIKAIEGLQ